MTLAHTGSNAYMLHNEEQDARPLLISRHSSCLPAAHRNDTKKKALSRRSRSASPCVKKTNSAHSGTVTDQNSGLRSEYQHFSPQLSVIKKQSYISVKNLKAPRGSLSAAKQRSQVLGEHRKGLRFSLWERISSSKSDPPSTDVNSNIEYMRDKLVGAPTVKIPHLHQLPTFSSQALANEDLKPQANYPIFDFLPTECKLKIFSYLNQMERGRCMFVSKNWCHMIKTPHLWINVNLREFRLCYGHDTLDRSLNYIHDQSLMEVKTPCNKECYARYINRIDRYILFLIDTRPKVKRLELSFDLATDSWIDTIRRLFRHVNFSSLKYVDIDWHDTPIKPSYLYGGYNLKDIVYTTRRRTRLFLNFLEEFVSDMPNITSLIMPFHWAARSMKCVSSFKYLKNLVLKKYTVFQAPSQQVFDELANMKCLEQLLVEVWISANTTPIPMFHIRSSTLKYLDLSQCRGFYLQSVDLPSLQVLIVDKRSSLAQTQTQNNVPCLCGILLQGAPSLQQINRTKLSSLDKTSLERLLESICPSRTHSHY